MSNQALAENSGAARIPANGRAVLSIPSPSMLQYKPLAHWVGSFREATGFSPTEIVLPAIAMRQPTYLSVLRGAFDAAPANAHREDFRRWIAEAREILGVDGVVWANVVMDFGFLDTEHISLFSQYNSVIGGICVVNPVARGIVSVAIDEILEYGVDGIAFDCTDLLPNSTATGMNDVALTCFCEYCITALREQRFNSPVERFMGPTGLARLFLKATSTGADHIDPSHEMIHNRDASLLARIAIGRGFVEEESPALVDECMTVLRYFEARSGATARALRELTGPVSKRGMRSSIILGSVDFDQSQQVTAQDLIDQESCDEVWVSDARSSHSGTYLCFLGARSSYSINAFFDVVEGANSIASSAGLEHFLTRLVRVSKRLSSNRLSPAASYVALHSPQYTGFAAVPLLPEDHLGIVENLTSQVTGSPLPQQVLEQFRISAGGSVDLTDSSI